MECQNTQKVKENVFLCVLNRQYKTTRKLSRQPSFSNKQTRTNTAGARNGHGHSGSSSRHIYIEIWHFVFHTARSVFTAVVEHRCQVLPAVCCMSLCHTLPARSVILTCQANACKIVRVFICTYVCELFTRLGRVS